MYKSNSFKIIMQKNVRDTSPFTIATNNIKYIGSNSTRKYWTYKEKN